MQIYSFRFGVGPGISAGSGPQVPAPRKSAPQKPSPTPSPVVISPARGYNPVISGGRALADKVENSAPVRATRWVVDLPGRLAEGIGDWFRGYRSRVASKFQPRLPETPSMRNKGTSPGISSGESARRPIPIGGFGAAIGGGPRGATPGQLP